MKKIIFLCVAQLCVISLMGAEQESSYKAFEANKKKISSINLAALTALSLEAIEYPEACKIHKELDTVAEEMIPSYEIIIQRGDICSAPVEAIVNAANKELLGGAGVCGAIFAAAGEHKLQDACDMIKGGCPVGQACITASFDLAQKGPIQHIIHAVGPDCRRVKDRNEQDRLLADSYKNSLLLVDKYKMTSVAFPFISSGIYGFPKEKAAQIALESVTYYAQKNKTDIKKIYFVLFSQDDYDLFLDCIKKREDIINAKISKIII